MKLSGFNKLVLLGLILLIVAGIFVVALKGVNVALDLHQHESILVKVEKEINLKDINEICNDVFEGKKYLVKKVELFSDSVDVIVESITDEEKEELVNKINEKYETTLNAEMLSVRSDSNVRIRDLVIPYVIPTIISVLAIGVIYVVVYRTKDILVKYLKTLVLSLLTTATIASIIAITRIPFSGTTITIILFIVLIQIMYCMNKNK